MTTLAHKRMGAVDPAPLVQPPKWKLTVATWLGVYPIITVLVWLLWPLMGSWPMPARTFLLSALMVPALTFVVMPRITAWLRPWLTRAPRSGGRTL